MKGLNIPEGHVLVQGRSQKRAAELLEAADELNFKNQVSTTSRGYIVRKEIADLVANKANENKAKAEDDQSEAQEEALAKAVADAEAKAEAEKTAKEQEDQNDLFDPSAHNVEEVVAYIGSDVTDEERERVLSAEKSGKNRATVLAADKGDK